MAKMQYVKDFDFNVKPCEYSSGGGVEALKAYAKGGAVKPPSGMIKNRGTLGVVNNKNPGETSKHTAPKLPGKPSAYAKGGKVMEKATGESYPSRKAMMKHEMAETPRTQREEVVQRASIKGLPPRRSVPVAPTAPLVAMKMGGGVSKAGMSKIPKVMGEFKAGELHSGSKTGPVVKNQKQAVAIAMSEARKAGKR